MRSLSSVLSNIAALPPSQEKMPVITASSNSAPLIDGLSSEIQWLYPRLPVSLVLLTVVLVGLVFRRQVVRQQLVKRLALVNPAEADITCTAGSPVSRNITISSPVVPAYCWAQPTEQGQGRVENWHAKLAVSRRGAGGTALAGPRGARKGGRMEEEHGSPPSSSGSRSRGVSTTDGTDEVKVSGGLSFLSGQLLSRAERSNHVTTSVIHDAPVLREDHQHRMEESRFAGVSAGLTHGSGPGTPGRMSTSFFGHHMMDDEHILYGVQDPDDSGSAVDRWSPSTHRSEQDFTKSLSPLAPPASTGRPPSLHVPAHEERAKTIAIPSRTSTGGSSRAVYLTEDAASPSSYPPTSPLLPPPPATTYEAFDPAAVMFPGPARDGGIKMVPVDRDEIGEPAHVHAHISDGVAESGQSWKRHTRVYGGGVCLACAAAAGEGGFYGDSVRPEDKR